MEARKIKQFTGVDEVEVRGNKSKDSVLGTVVILSQYAGSMGFSFAMKPEQARELAAALIAHADDVESK